jgi:hypothetical protein
MLLKLLQAHLCRHRMSSQLLLLLYLPLYIPETPCFHDMLFHLDLRVKHLLSVCMKNKLDPTINFLPLPFLWPPLETPTPCSLWTPCAPPPPFRSRLKKRSSNLIYILNIIHIQGIRRQLGINSVRL